MQRPESAEHAEPEHSAPVTAAAVHVKASATEEAGAVPGARSSRTQRQRQLLAALSRGLPYSSSRPARRAGRLASPAHDSVRPYVDARDIQYTIYNYIYDNNTH